MKFPKFLLAMTIASSSVFVSAQPPDENVADLFNRQDWLTLEKIFPEIKDSIRDPCLRYMTQSLLDCSFNRPRQALGALDTLMGPLLVNMSFSNIPSMVLFRCEAMRLNKKYAAAADYLDSFLRYLSATMDISRFPEHLQMSRLLNGLRDAPAPEIVRPERDVRLPLAIRPVVVKGRTEGAHLSVPVAINGKTYPFTLDTGTGTTAISQRLADELGLRTICDSIRIDGIGSRLGSLAIADSLCVGNIVYKNPVVAVLPPNPAVDTLLYIDAILGRDLLIAVGEVQIYPKKKKTVFPATPTPSPLPEKNLVLMNGGDPYLEAWSGDERLLMLFDTGNSTGGMYPSYYRKHKERIETEGAPDTVLVGGMDLYTATVYRLPGFSLRTCGSEIGIDNMIVETAENGPSRTGQSGDGVLGMDFIRQFRKVTINFSQMYVAAEK